MDKLIEEAVKVLEENLGLNEVTLSNGANTVHLVRFTPTPAWYYTSLYPIQYPQY